MRYNRKAPAHIASREERDRDGRRARHRRCPLCKKIRYWWMRPNDYTYGHRTNKQRVVVDGVEMTVCWLCARRLSGNHDEKRPESFKKER